MLGFGRRFDAALDRLVDDDVRQRVDEAIKDLNRYGYDPWGASPVAAKRMLTMVSYLYRRYFRVQTEGLDNIPEGRVLVIGNHSSQLAYDGVLVAASFTLAADPPRFLRAMIERFFASAPLIGVMMTRVGQLTGIPQHAEQLLERDYAVLVFPEGHRGGGRVWRDRYKVLDFGHGFMRLALKTGTPILPFGFVGGEEMCPSFSRMEPLARLFGTPYWPLTPTVVPVPLPARCRIVFGDLMRFDGDGSEPDKLISPKVKRVEAAVADCIHRGLEARGSIFL